MIALVLGHKGMLGNCVTRYLALQHCGVETIDDLWDSVAFREKVRGFKGDFIINCIAALGKTTPPAQKASINVDLPLWLMEHPTAKLILPGTDGEFSGNTDADAFYYYESVPDAEDDYGRAKARLSEETRKRDNVRVLRTSIVGIETQSHTSLLSWFLNLRDHETVNGFTNILWNGVTTLEWAKWCYRLMSSWQDPAKSGITENRGIVQLGSEKISKFGLLKLFSETFGKPVTILAGNGEKAMNRCLFPYNQAPGLKEQLSELKLFYGL